MKAKIKVFVFLLLVFNFSLEAEAARLDLSRYKDLRLDHSFCQGRAKFPIGRDYFVEVANDLPGVDRYNELVRHYRRKRWPQFEEGVQKFRGEYSNSPLAEAVDFVEVQSLFERLLDQVGPPDGAQAEQKFRELFVKYPQSQFLPVLFATAGNFWLQQQNFARSLQLYEAAREKFPFHSSSCVALSGIAETRYLAGEGAKAAPTFRLILQKCDNPRLQVAAKVRLADIALKKNLKTARKLYESALKQDLNRFNRFHPHALHNLGEINFRHKRYQTAKFYFDEYLRHTPREASCRASALKRDGDIALQTNKRLKSIVGKYMLANDQAPATDFGKYSLLRGLMVGMEKVKQGEFERRLRIIDEEIDNIQDEKFRTAAYIEKGISLLGVGKLTALNYLERLQKNRKFNPTGKFLKRFGRQRILALLSADSRAVQAGKKPYDEDETLVIIERVGPTWFKGSKDWGKLRAVFTRSVLNRFEQSFEKDPERAIKQLQQWSQGSLYRPASAGAKARKKVAVLLLDKLRKADDGTSLGVLYTKNEKLLKPLVDRPYRLLWVAVAQKLGDNKRLKKLTAQLGASRAPASIGTPFPSPIRDYAQVLTARAFRSQKQFRRADAAYRAVRKEPWLGRALQERYDLYGKTKQPKSAFQVGLKLFDRSNDNGKAKWLGTLVELVEKHKMYPQIDNLLKAVSRNSKLPSSGRAQVYHLAAQRAYVQAKHKTATRYFESALSADGGYKKAAEAKYKLGKSLLSLRRPAEAKKIWEELVALNDSFWSPMARNELHILSK